MREKLSDTERLNNILKITPPLKPKEWRKNIIIIIISIIVLLWAFNGSKFRITELITGVPALISTINRMFPPDFSEIMNLSSYEIKSFSDIFTEQWWNNIFPQTIIGATIQTIQMALAGTFIAMILSFPISFLAAQNTSPHPIIYYIIRGLLNFLRTIPDLALGLIFVSAVGLGSFAGTMALSIHTTTVLAKLLSEAIENIDEGIVEAIKSTGARYFQVISFAIVPQILPDFISFTLYRFETNIRSASVLGLIGAGGIGYLLNTSFRTFQFQKAASIILILIILVMTVDYISAKLRKMII